MTITSNWADLMKSPLLYGFSCISLEVVRIFVPFSEGWQGKKFVFLFISDMHALRVDMCEIRINSECAV